MYIYEKVDKAEIANKYELPDKFIFYPAQFWSHKNHRNLIKGFKLISDELPDLKLVLSGHRNHCYKEIRSLVLRLGLEKKVLFVGYVPNQDIRGFYENAVAMVIPSCCPISIPLLEALVCGCPVAIADISFNKEQLGKAALYFNPESVEEIASTLVALNDESVKKSLIKAGEVLQHKFSQELFNTRFASIVELVLTRKYGQKKLNIKTKEIKLIR
ncbi:MAG: glycosyltransferase [bacterium]